MKPCALDIVELVCGTDQTNEVEVVTQSNDVIHFSIVEVSPNILTQAVGKLNSSSLPFNRQSDESTNVSQCNQLLVFVHYAYNETQTMEEEFPFYDSHLGTNKASHVPNTTQFGRLSLVV